MTKKRFKVLFVCTGNSCRSPMAEGILNRILKSKGITHIQVQSAGTMPPYQMAPTSYAVLTSLEHGVDISAYRSKDLTKSMIEEANLILVMEKAHLRFIKNLTDAADKKVFLLKSYGKDKTETGAEIEDPIGMDMDYYRSCYDELEYEIKRILPYIEKMAAK